MFEKNILRPRRMTPSRPGAGLARASHFAPTRSHRRRAAVHAFGWKINIQKYILKINKNQNGNNYQNGHSKI